MCGIIGISNHKDAGRLSYLGLYALQHRGEESAGIVAFNGSKINYHKGMGLVCDVFDERSINILKGSVAIGHVRYSTTGSSHMQNIQPFYVGHKKGHIIIAHNGNLTNTVKLRNRMEHQGSIFQTTMDSEIITHLMVCSRGDDLKNNVISALSQLEGAYSFAMMVNDVLIGARDPHGFRPLCLGKVDEAYVLASETCALDLINAKYIRDIEPGEIVFITKNNIESIKPFAKKKHAICIFEYIYFARPDSNIFDKNVYLTRKQLGKNLAKESGILGDVVMPIPDSGSYAAMGYAQELGVPLEMGMIRNHYVGRTFIQPSQVIRDFRVKVKLNPIREVLAGKTVVIVEDSIVRGTTSRIRVKTVREAGAKEVHMRVSCPPIKFPCFYGIDFPTKKELIATGRSVDGIRKSIGLDSLNYLSVEGMVKSMFLPGNEFCTACFTGKYPTKVSRRASKNMLEK
ncbi:MAG: amidophosphoribosyltransferase [Candidatus Omnitrophota bacterium]|nr:amidophosphoribosyltransferase [Candidatus Omnitrophota bacterium]